MERMDGERRGSSSAENITCIEPSVQELQELKDVYGEMVGNDAGEEGQGRVHRTFSAMLEFLAFTLLAKRSL